MGNLVLKTDCTLARLIRGIKTWFWIRIGIHGFLVAGRVVPQRNTGRAAAVCHCGMAKPKYSYSGYQVIERPLCAAEARVRSPLDWLRGPGG
jgi:hypothetical protein